MSSRKHLCGNDKRKKKHKKEQFIKSLSGSLNKYLTSGKQNEGESIDIVDIVENVVSEEAVNVSGNEPVDIVDHDEDQEGINNDLPPDHEEQGDPLDMYDPNNWKSIDQNFIDLLVEKWPIRVEIEDSEYPRDPDKKRHFSNVHYTRRLSNGEKQDRKWLVYSKSADKVFCFCCKLFKDKEEESQLTSTGFRDWHNLGNRLKQHDCNNDHMVCMEKWIELETRLRCKQTIDKSVQEQITREKEHKRQVLIRVIAVVKSLAKSNLAFRGSNEKVYEEDNGNFLSMIQMIAEFDPIMQDAYSN